MEQQEQSSEEYKYDEPTASTDDHVPRMFGKPGALVLSADNLSYNTEKTELESILMSILSHSERPDSLESLPTFGLINQAKIYKMILNSFVPMNSLVVAFTGLPACGKTKAMTKMVRKFMSPAVLDKMASIESKDCSLSTYNLCVLGGYPFKKFHWTPTSKRYSITYFTLSDLIRTAILRNGNPLEFKFDLETPPPPDCRFEKMLHNEHINWLLKQLHDLYDLIINKRQLTIGLFQTGVTLVNGLDVGVNKGLYDFLPVIATFCRKLVRIVFFSLDRDVKNFSECPDLSDDKYKERHDQHVMRWRPRLAYLLHHAAAGYIPNLGRDHRTIMIGVTESLDDDTASQLLKEARRVIENEAKSLKIEQTFHNEWLYINLSNDKSISQTRDVLEQIIVHNPKFRCVVQLRWIFLRSLIASVDQKNPPVIMAKKVIVELAEQLEMNERDVDDFLETFTDFASLLYAPTFEPLREYVIVDLKKFTDLLDQIYYPSDPNSLIAKYGIITKTFINRLMASNLAEQVLAIMTSIGMVAYVPPKRLLLNHQLKDDEFYFLPTARTSDISNGAQLGSAYIVIESDHVPVSSQAVIAHSILKKMPELILVAHTPINITRVRIEHDRSQPAIDIEIIYQGRMTELRICNTDDTVLTHQSAINKCSKLLTVCCEAFTSQSEYFRGLRFNIGLRCYRGEKRYHYLYPDKKPDVCEDCIKVPLDSFRKQDFWRKAANKCPCLSSVDQHRFQESSLDADFAAKLATFLSDHKSLQDCAKKQQFINALGLTESVTSLQGYSGWQFYMMLILTWEKGASSKERTKEELKRIINETLDITY